MYYISTEFLNTYIFIPWIFTYVYIHMSTYFYMCIYTYISHLFLYIYIYLYFDTYECFFKPLHIDRPRVRHDLQDRLQPSNSRSV